MKEGIDLSQQIPFGSDAPRKQDHPSRVMEMLGHEMIGGYFETFLPSSFVERVASGEIEFGSLSEELLVLSEELLDVEKELVEGESGLPKAADAEMYMDPEYAMRTAEGNLVGVTESKVVSKFRDGESDDVVFVQKSFQSVEAIDAKISQVGKFMNQALAEIVKLREDPFFRHLNLPVDQTGELIDLGPLNRNKIQKLAVWDLHWRNLRELARVYAMYRDMTMGSLNPTKIENGQSWVMEDDSEKFSLRSQAEMISGEIYGELDESVWQGDMYLYLGSFWGKNEAMDKLVNELMDKYLPDFPRETRDELERKRLILSEKKEKQARGAASSRVVKAVSAGRKMGLNDDSRESVVGFRNKFVEIIGSKEDRKMLNEMVEEYASRKLKTITEEHELAEIADSSLDDMLSFFSDNENVGRLNEIVSSLRLMEIVNPKVREVLDVLNLNERDLDKYEEQGKKIDEIGDTWDSQKYLRSNSIEFVNFVRNMLNDMGVETDIIWNESSQKNEGNYRIIVEPLGNISASSAEFFIKVPINRQMSMGKMVKLFAHEIMAHVGGLKRVEKQAPMLANSFNSNAPNEGLAKLLEMAVGKLMLNPQRDKINLVKDLNAMIDIEGDEDEIEEDEDMFFEAGMMHKIAIGLHLGYGGGNQNGQTRRRDMGEVFASMKDLYALKFSHAGHNETVVEERSAKQAFAIGVRRQLRGLWTHLTMKNMVYAAGAREVNKILEANKDLGILTLGKAGLDHEVYQKIFGIREDAIDDSWKILDRSVIMRNLGLD